MNLGRQKDALESLHEALLTVERLVSSGHAEFASDIALGNYNIGEALIRAGQFEEALTHHDLAIRHWGDSGIWVEVAYSLSSEADALVQLGRFDEALAKSDESIRLFRQVLAAESNPKLTEALATAVNFRGVVLGRLGKVREAAACFREAAELRESTRASRQPE